MEAKLGRLHLDLASTQRSGQHANSRESNEVAESWDEEAYTGSEDESDTPVEAPGPSLKQMSTSDSIPQPPPPTPISPKQGGAFVDWSPANVMGGGIPRSYEQPRQVERASQRDRPDEERRRPEKTTAVAGRMIAGALGVKAPKKTEEQRQYEKSVKEQEIRRKNRERERKEQEGIEDDKSKSAVWDS